MLKVSSDASLELAFVSCHDLIVNAILRCYAFQETLKDHLQQDPVKFISTGKISG